MSNNQPHYETMPEHYTLCFIDECPLAATCLHRLAAQSGRQQDYLVTIVNPAKYDKDNTCRYYKENKLVTMAYGMVHSFHDVKADDIAALRNRLIKHFGHTSYYLRRNGIRAIPPNEQDYIAGVFRKFGYEIKFDKTEESTLWQ